MGLVESKMAEFAMIGFEPKIENAVICVINDIFKKYYFYRMTDANLARIKHAILEECGSYISNLSLEPFRHDGTIRITFKTTGGTWCQRNFPYDV